jgi:Zn-dependent protease
MRGTLQLGRIGGVTIEAHWSVAAIVAIVAWGLAAVTLPALAPDQPSLGYGLVGILGALALFGSILAHELSHAAVARHHGIEVERITLWLFGGMAHLGRSAPDPDTELRIGLAGPAMSAAIAVGSGAIGGLALLLGAPRLLAAGLLWLGLVNGLLAVFNLLPGAPLDGGRVLGAVLWRRWGDEHAARVSAARAGRVVGQLLIGLGMIELLLGAGIGGLWLALIGWFLITAARTEEQGLMTRWLLHDVRVRNVMTPRPVAVRADRTVADFVHGEALALPWSTYPVVDAAGALTGLITLRRVRALPRDLWPITPLRDVAIPRTRLPLVAPDDLLLDALARPGEGDGRLLVIQDDDLVGIVSPSDVTRALERFALARSGAAPPGRAPPTTSRTPTRF